MLKKDVKKYSFPDRAIDKWNALPEEVVCVKNIHSFKEKYDDIMSKDGTYELDSILWKCN